MSVVNIASLSYQPVGPRGEQWAAQVALAISTSYVINLQNAVTLGDRAINIAFAVIDNIAGGTAVSVTMGNLVFAVPPFTREVLGLPAGLQSLGVNVGTGGGVTVTLSDGKPINDQTNFLSIQQTAAATLVYQFVVYSVDQNQLSSDLNKTVLFLPTLANMTYSLLLASIAGNGWLEFVYNQGTKAVDLAPTPPNTLNGSAGAITLQPGESGVLQSDGAAWYFMDIKKYNAIIQTLSDLPNAAGALMNDGAGVLSWASTGGFELLGTVNTNAGTSQVFTGIPGGVYRNFYLEIEAVSFAAGPVASLGVAGSINNGVSYGGSAPISSGISGASTVSGVCEINGVSTTQAVAKSVQSYVSDNVGTFFSTPFRLPMTGNGSVNALRFTPGALAFDAGTIKIYGVK